MRKDKLSLLLLLIGLLGATPLFIGVGQAEHAADVIWWKAEIDGVRVGTVQDNVLNMPKITYPIWVYFNVTNSKESENRIVAVKVGIPWDGATQQALFNFMEGSVGGAAEGWTYEMQNLDPDGDPREIWYTTGESGNPIEPGSTGIFGLKFRGGPESCNYRFIIFTEDDAGKSHSHYLDINIDGISPVVSIVHPPDTSGYDPKEKNVTAIWDPYPDRYYIWINGTANDPADHFSGISHIDIYINKTLWKSINYEPPYTNETFEVKAWNDILPKEGWYNVTVVAFDGAGNSASKTHIFYLHIPGVFISITPEEGTIWRKTWIDDEGVYRSTIYKYGGKQLGTEVIVKGTGFTANSEVNVTVAHPLWGEILVAKNIKTDENGCFTTSFVFPTAPQGTYEVNAIDLNGKKTLHPARFTVIPEIIYKPAVVIGPAPIEVIATGLPANAKVTGLTCNGTDALLGVNLQILNSWYTDENGTLRTIWADEPGLLIPVLEPGTYEIGLKIMTTTISNCLYVVNDLKSLTDILDQLELKLDCITPIIERIDNNVVEIKTDIGIIKEDVKNIIENITIVKEGVVEVNTKVGKILGYVEDIGDDVLTIKTDVGDIKIDVGDIKTNLVKPRDVTLGISISAVLSAIAAIAAIAAVVVVTKRLKVAA